MKLIFFKNGIEKHKNPHSCLNKKGAPLSHLAALCLNMSVHLLWRSQGVSMLAAVQLLRTHNMCLLTDTLSEPLPRSAWSSVYKDGESAQEKGEVLHKTDSTSLGTH